jgi:hypothetical protein
MVVARGAHERAILYLAGPRGRMVTGQVLHVNGGLVMP